MVKLSRISLGFFILASLPAFLALTIIGSGLCATLFAGTAFLAGGDFLTTGGRTAVFFAAAGAVLAGAELAVAAARPAAGAAALATLARAAGLARTAVVVRAARVAGFALAGFLVPSAMVNLPMDLYEINSIFS
jgi:hypothetical protein